MLFVIRIVLMLFILPLLEVREVFRLSDAFISPTETPSLELVVTVFNVAKGHNADLLLRCTPLSDYSVFISLINDGVDNGLALGAAIDSAIHYCIKNDIMRVYLQEKSAEVKRMLITEWDDDVYREVIREEAIEEEKIATARRMKEYGDPINKIADITGLPLEEIADL